MKKVTPIIAILAILVLELYALNQQVNGLMLSVAVAAIAGIGGFVVKPSRKG